MSQQFNIPPVLSRIEVLTNTLNMAIVAEQHRSGAPWMKPDNFWNLDNVHGLSIFLPLGEDLELPLLITDTVGMTRNLRLRDMYSTDQLRFVADTGWDTLINTYYETTLIYTETTTGPIGVPLDPDVMPPQTVITTVGVPMIGEGIYIAWSAGDTQSGVVGATFWHRLPGEAWQRVGLTMPVSSGIIPVQLSTICQHSIAVRGIDRAGNLEPLNNTRNILTFDVMPCIRLYLPLLMREY
jgi:hypothetical protein